MALWLPLVLVGLVASSQLVTNDACCQTSQLLGQIFNPSI